MSCFSEQTKRAADLLKEGKVCVLPTDTLYGLCGSAAFSETVEKVYQLKRRDLKKPMIVLIGRLKDLKLFAVKLNRETKKILKKFWPGEVSVILPCYSERFSYLHRGMNSLAFRLPGPTWLRKLLKKTGPLVAPSCNPEGLRPAQTIAEARQYFKDDVAFYLDKGTLSGLPSTLIEIENGKAVVKRKGRFQI